MIRSHHRGSSAPDGSERLGVCFISSEYPSEHHRGGIATYTEKTAMAIAARGYDVSVITEAARVPRIELEGGVRVVRLAAPVGRLRAVAFARAASRAVAQLGRQPDVIQVCEHRAEGFWVARHRRRGSALVTRLATPTFLVQELNSDVTYSRVRTRYMDALERYQTRHSDAIISPTRALADVVCRRWRIASRRVAIMRTGVDFRARFAASAGVLPESLRAREYILYFGRLEERKGVHILARALPEVLDAHPQLHIVLAGDNLLSFRGQPMRAYVEGQLRAYGDRLHVLPRMPQRDLYPILSNALMVVLPSLWEALGNVTLEAMDMGKPVIATSGSGFGEVIEDGRSGLLVPPGDEAGLRSALLRLAGDNALRRRLAKSAADRARTFDLDLTVDELLSFYKRVLNPGPPRRGRGPSAADEPRLGRATG